MGLVLMFILSLIEDNKEFLKRALDKLNPDTPEYIKSQDILDNIAQHN